MHFTKETTQKLNDYHRYIVRHGPDMKKSAAIIRKAPEADKRAYVHFDHEMRMNHSLEGQQNLLRQYGLMTLNDVRLEYLDNFYSRLLHRPIQLVRPMDLPEWDALSSMEKRALWSVWHHMLISCFEQVYRRYGDENPDGLVPVIGDGRFPLRGLSPELMVLLSHCGKEGILQVHDYEDGVVHFILMVAADPDTLEKGDKT